MATWLTKIYNFSNIWRQPTRRTNLTFDKYLPYFDSNGYADNFPLAWHKAISESPSATACVSTIGDFMEGEGFKDKNLESKIINSQGETLFQLHQRTCRDFSEFEGFFWRVMYDATGKITEWDLLPFENCRLGKPDDKGFISKVLYNPYFGTVDFKIGKDTVEYDTFNPKAVKAQILDQKEKYKGQVLFVGTTTALSRFYPLPEAYASIKWMSIETSVADYHEDNIKNGLLQPFMLVMRGNPNEPSKNPEYADVPDNEKKTIGQEFDEVISANFMGAKKVGNVWVQWVAIGEEIPTTLTFPSNNSGDLFLTVDQQATKKITIAFKVPGVLANIHEGVSLGGDGNQIRVAVKLMQQRVVKKQRVLTDSYQTILKNFSTAYLQDIKITPYNPYPELETLADPIWQALTTQEKRDWIEANTEIILFDDELQPDQLPAPAPAARLTNAVPLSFPEKIRNNVKKALEYQEKMDLKCGGRAGREVSDAIMNNTNMGQRQLKRIYSYLKKNEQYSNSTYNEGCDAIRYAAWGGKDMFDFLDVKLKEIDRWLN